MWMAVAGTGAIITVYVEVEGEGSPGSPVSENYSERFYAPYFRGILISETGQLIFGIQL